MKKSFWSFEKWCSFKKQVSKVSELEKQGKSKEQIEFSLWVDYCEEAEAWEMKRDEEESSKK